jgi:hypothetical protein
LIRDPWIASPARNDKGCHPGLDPGSMDCEPSPE